MLTKYVCDKCENKLLHYMDEMIDRKYVKFDIYIRLQLVATFVT